jgi:hypothetical protein
MDGVSEVSIEWHTESSFLAGESLVRFGKLGVALRSLIYRLPLGLIGG